MRQPSACIWSRRPAGCSRRRGIGAEHQLPRLEDGADNGGVVQSHRPCRLHGGVGRRQHPYVVPFGHVEVRHELVQCSNGLVRSSSRRASVAVPRSGGDSPSGLPPAVAQRPRTAQRTARFTPAGILTSPGMDDTDRPEATSRPCGGDSCSRQVAMARDTAGRERDEAERCPFDVPKLGGFDQVVSRTHEGRAVAGVFGELQDRPRRNPG